MLNFARLPEIVALLTFLQIWNASGYPAIKNVGIERESTPIKAVSQSYCNIETTIFSRKNSKLLQANIHCSLQMDLMASVSF